MTNDGNTLRAVIGARVRLVRMAGGATVDDVARTARRYGLRWNASRAGELERGQKSISAEELLLLPRIMSDVLGRPVTLGELLDGEEPVALTAEAITSARDVAQLVDVRPDEVPIVLAGEIDEGMRALSEATQAHADLTAAKAWASAAGHVVRVPTLLAVERTAGEAETKAAAKLGVSRSHVIVASAVAWGRSLTAERDHRVDGRTPIGVTPRSVQAIRGRVTRELVDRLRELLSEGK